MTTFNIDYRSGVQSVQEADSPEAALALEFVDAHASAPVLESCYSGANWDFCVYPDGAEQPFEKSYFVAMQAEDELFSRRF